MSFDCNPITQFASADCNFTTTGLKPEKTECRCQGVDVFRRGIKRTCKLRNVQNRPIVQCNTVDILAVEKGVTTFELEPAQIPPLTVQVNDVPPLNKTPRVFPNRGNFAVSQNSILA